MLARYELPLFYVSFSVFFIKAVVFDFLAIEAQEVAAQNGFYQLAVLKYRGDCTPILRQSLRAFCNDELAMGLGEEVATVEVGCPICLITRGFT